MNQEKIKVVIAGIGFIGPVHIESLRRLGHIDIVAIFGRDKEATIQKAQTLNIKKAYVDFDKLIDEEPFDCIHICTPNHLHYSMAKAALLAGKHVVCEKPLATTISEAEELITLARETKKVHAVNFNVRYYPLIRQMKTMRESGELGKVYSIIGSYLQDWLFLETDYNWRLEPDKSGDSRAIADIGSHLMDLIEYISGLKITQVMADFATPIATRKKPLKAIETYSGKILAPGDYADVPITTEDYANVLLRFDDGSKGVITVSQIAAGRKNRITLEISGSKQSVSWCSEDPNKMWIGKRETANGSLMRDPSLVTDEVRSIMSYPGGHNEGFGDTSKHLFKEIYEAVANNRQPDKPTFPTFEDGLRELILCERIIESQKEEKWVRV